LEALNLLLSTTRHPRLEEIEMYMERITPAATAQAGRTRAPTPLKIAAGLIFLAFSAVVMVPYAIALAAYVLAATVAQTAARAVTAAYRTVIYAGEVIVGR
jgi:hypothetical protein